jgi:hypothetical protein
LVSRPRAAESRPSMASSRRVTLAHYPREIHRLLPGVGVPLEHHRTPLI